MWGAIAGQPWGGERLWRTTAILGERLVEGQSVMSSSPPYLKCDHAQLLARRVNAQLAKIPIPPVKGKHRTTRPWPDPEEIL